jgi:hypothetical protein
LLWCPGMRECTFDLIRQHLLTNADQPVSERLFFRTSLTELTTNRSADSMPYPRSIIVDYLQNVFKTDRVAILYIYCNYREQSRQTISNLVASLLKQLVQDSSTAYDNIKSFYNRHRDHETRPTLDELRAELRSQIERYSKAFIVVDALDECAEVGGTRAGLLAALRSLPVNLLVTSRELHSISEEFCGSKRLDILASNQDVQRYIESRIPHEPRLARHVKNHPELQDEIVTKITKNAGGMYVS